MLYGSTPTTALQAPPFPADPSGSTSAFDGGYAMPSGYGMFTMASDDDDNTVSNGHTGGGHNTTGTGNGGSYNPTSMASTNTLYNMPSYYQAGSYGGINAGGAPTYRVQSTRKLPTGTGTSHGTTSAPNNNSNSNAGPAYSTGGPHTTHTTSTASTAQPLYGPSGTGGGNNAMQRSDYGGLGSSFDYGDADDFYGGVTASALGGGGPEGGTSESGRQPAAWMGRGNATATVRSGATTATSLGDCHLSRKDDGGFTPQTDNTFVRSGNSLGAGSLDSRGGDRSALSDMGSAYDTGYYSNHSMHHLNTSGNHQNTSNSMSQTVSDPSLTGQPQRRLSESFRKDISPPSTTAQNTSGNSLSHLSKSDHVAPVLTPSPGQRGGAPPPPNASAGAKAALPQRKRSFTDADDAQTLKKSRSFHAYRGDSSCGAAGCSPLYDTDGGSSSEKATPTAPARAPPAAPATKTFSTSPRQHGTSSPPRAVTGANNQSPQMKPRSVAPDTKRINEMGMSHSTIGATKVLLPEVPESVSARSAPSPSRAKSIGSPLAGRPKPDAASTPKWTGSSPLQNKSRETLEKLDRMARTHVESPKSDSTSGHSGHSSTSSSKQPRTPPSRKPAKEKTTPPSRHTGTILPSTLATVTPQPPPHSAAQKPAAAKSPRDSTRGAKTAKRAPAGSTASSRNGLAATTTTAATGPSVCNSKETSNSSPSPVQLSQTLNAPAFEATAANNSHSGPGGPIQLATFTVAPPPSDTRDPNRFFRRRYLNPPVAPLSATEVSKSVAGATHSPLNHHGSAPTSTGSRAAPSGTTSTKAPGGRDIRGSSLASSNMSPLAVNNLVGDGTMNNSAGGVRGAAGISQINNSKLNGSVMNGGNASSKPQPPPQQRRRRPSTTAGAASSPSASGATINNYNIVPSSHNAEGTRDTTSAATGSGSRHRSGSETHSLNDAAGSAQSRSCPSMDLSMDEGTNPYLQHRSSSWSGHSTVCSSDSGDGSHGAAARVKRQQERMLPSVEEEMERYNAARLGMRH